MPRKPPTVARPGQKHGRGSRWHKTSKAARAIEPLCRLCLSSGRSVPATCVDHIVPLMDGGTSTASNLQPLCKACHARKTAADMGSARKRGPWASRITILAGAPGAGKTTLARKHLAGNDLLYDYDALVAATSLAAPWSADALALAIPMRRIRDAIISAATDGHVQGRVWLLMADLQAAIDLSASLPADLLILHPGIDACMDAIRSRRLHPERERDACLAATRFDATLRVLLEHPSQPLRGAQVRRLREDPLPATPAAEASGVVSGPETVPPSETAETNTTPRSCRHKRARPGYPPFPPPLPAAPARPTLPPAPYR